MSTSEWKPTAPENPNFRCRKCGSNNIRYAIWESSDGAYEDKHYHCDECGNDWWVESSDY